MPLRWSLAAHSSLVAFVFCPVYDVVLLLLLPMSDLLVRLIVFDRLLVSRVFESPLLVLQLSFPSWSLIFSVFDVDRFPAAALDNLFPAISCVGCFG